MHLDQTAFQLSPKTVEIAPKRRPKSVLIFGDIQNNTDGADMLLLTAGLLEAGLLVETASARSHPLVRRIVNFRTPYKFEQSKRFLSRYDTVVVLLDSIASPAYRSASIWGKIKERYRMALFLKELNTAGRETILVGTRRDQLKTASIARDGITVIKPKNLVATLVQRLTKHPMRPMAVDTARARVLEHANFQDNDGKLTAQKVRRYLNGTQTHDPDLLTLCDLALALQARDISLVKRLQRCTDPNADPVHQTLPPFPVLDTATSLDKSNNLPNYVWHLFDTLKPRLKCDPTTPQGREVVMKWYHTKARDHLPVFWVPIINTNSNATVENANSTGIAQIEALLNLPHTNPIICTETLALLSKQTTPTAPTGLAILLALLCRLNVPSNGLKNPWESDEIATWFAQTVCAISPNLRPFSRTNTPLAKPKAFAEIVGQPNQETGLGMNMRMSTQAFDQKELFFKTRDLDNGCDICETAHSRTLLPKRNFVIHHVNADRVPMTIMTPHYAHRNDIYHIGYFLWETSRLPTNHQLGIQMVNEVWAPTKFVADLYKRAGAAKVTTVGKALHELPYLEKMAKITPTKRDLFTVFTGFDFHSSVERKNPMAVVKAFQIAFPKALFKHARLIVKTTPSIANHWGDPNAQMAQIRAAAQDDSRIEILEQMLPLQYLFKLMASADCIVSAHRGEGFGYLPAYGLALAKPVITTDWGGVTDFCTPDTSFPVAAPLVDVPKGHSIHHAPAAQWADVHPSALADQMRSVYQNPAQAKARARAGQRRVQTLYSPERLAQTYFDRLKQIGLI